MDIIASSWKDIFTSIGMFPVVLTGEPCHPTLLSFQAAFAICRLMLQASLQLYRGVQDPMNEAR